MSSKFNFVALPAELRLVIYKYIIQDVHIILDHEKDHEKIPGTQTRSGHNNFEPIHIRDMIKFVRPVDIHKIAMLQASTFCLEDATDVLAANTAIEFPSKGVDKDTKFDILTLVNPAFLKHIPAINMSPESFLHSDLTLLHRLKRVHLTAPLTTARVPISIVIHDLGCHRCGDLQAISCFDSFWTLTRDRQSQKTKLRQLAQDGPSKMELVLVIDGFCLNESASVRIELRYDLATGRLISKCVVKGGEVVLRDSQFDDVEMLMKLGYYV